MAKVSGESFDKFEQRDNKNLRGRFELYKRHEPHLNLASSENFDMNDKSRPKWQVSAYDLTIVPKTLVVVMKDKSVLVKWSEPDQMQTLALKRDKNKIF